MLVFRVRRFLKSITDRAGHVSTGLRKHRGSLIIVVFDELLILAALLTRHVLPLDNLTVIIQNRVLTGILVAFDYRRRLRAVGVLGNDTALVHEVKDIGLFGLERGVSVDPMAGVSAG